jgi:outer membrane protein assembly factor BamE (lipoprotein component of BamABCDE complex)
MRRLLKRWYFWLTVLVLLPALCIAIGVIYSGQTPINQANFDRIQEGMSDEEVSAILGDPTLGGGIGVDHTYFWVSGPDVITITFDGNGRVSAKGYNPPPAWQRLRWRVNNWLARRGLRGN